MLAETTRSITQVTIGTVRPRIAMDKSQPSRRNHYVPRWYQKGFILGSGKTLHYLDLDPSRKKLPNGETITRTELLIRSPKLCFRKKDLYSTRFGRTTNDDIEKFLFGGIDTIGAISVRGYCKNEPQVMHTTFQQFFQYMSAQKLRTPKGLDWINSKYPNLTQADLMIEMQHLRNMHCTMWFECVKEIVSAEKSDLKFIVTDHPVTTFNSACLPNSSSCRYPEDPSIDLTGTQTVFALDANHCLILTNLEYARDPTGANLLAPRQNARYFGRALTRTDTMIRSRTLTPEEVVSINSLLKSRACRHIAAYEKEWLFPERTRSPAWESIAAVLQPPSDTPWNIGGEVYWGHKDGSTHHQDEFGRLDSSHEFLRKRNTPNNLSPSDPCGCGSGRTYKKCCSGVKTGDRAPWNIYSVRARNQIFFNAVVDILGLTKGKTWDDVRRELSSDQVKQIHGILEMLWPRDTNIADLLPRPDKRTFRAVYMGLVDPRTIAASVIGPLMYFDEVVIVNPFTNPVDKKPEYSPTQSPEKYKSQMLKNVKILVELQPFIELGIVHLVPDPTDYNADTCQNIMGMAEKRTATWKPLRHEIQRMTTLLKEDRERQMLRLKEDELRRTIREVQPDLESDSLNRIIEYCKRKKASDPLTLLQPLGVGENTGDLQIYRSLNLELALFFAHLTGSAIYTDEPVYWRQLHEHTSAGSDQSQVTHWGPLVKTFETISLSIATDPMINLEARIAGKLARMRRVFRSIWNSVLTKDEDAEVDQIANRLACGLENASNKAVAEWDRCGMTKDSLSPLSAQISFSAPSAGFNMNSVHRLLVTSGRSNYIESVPIALFLRLESIQ